MEEKKTDILVIDDNDLFRKTLCSVINGSQTMTCQFSFPSGEEALRQMKQSNLTPEVILLDIGLPGINGVDLIRPLKEISPQSKIVMLTIHDDDDLVFNAICYGANGYLLKDLSSKQIMHSICEVLKGGAPMNAGIAKKVLSLFKKMAMPQEDFGLTRREKEILQLLVDGLLKKQIADKLNLSYHTVDSHIRNIYEKLEVNTRSGAVARALQKRIL